MPQNLRPEMISLESFQRNGLVRISANVSVPQFALSRGDSEGKRGEHVSRLDDFLVESSIIESSVRNSMNDAYKN